MSVVEPAFCRIMFQRVYLHNSEKPSPRSSLNLDYLNLSRSESPSSIASTSDLALTLDSRDSRSVYLNTYFFHGFDTAEKANPESISKVRCTGSMCYGY